VTDLADVALHEPTTYDQGFPHDLFRSLRAERPVSHHEHPRWEGGYWAIVRHEDVQRVSRDSATFRNAPHPFLEAEVGPDQSGTSELLISLDAPDHSKMRKLVSRGFTPRRVSDLTERVHARVDTIVDALRDRTEADLVTDVAVWLPLHVIADLVGVPEEDRRQVFEWTEITFGFDAAVTPAERQEAAMAMYAYADGMCEARRSDPRDDLMSVLLAAEVDGEQLTQLQIDLFFLLLQNAGSETTRNLITSGTLALLENPAQMDELRSDPALLPAAIEELLRYVTPVVQFCRTAVTDTEVGGQPIAAGDRLALFYASANRDERAFTDPDSVDVTRQPNDHVAFGAGGPHYCLGASLARLEARAMFEAILTRFDGLEVDPAVDVDALPRVHSNLIDGFAHLPVRWSAIK
jgi:cholest-4-en-3-one 26-monooxygenase